jgi:heme/copper-type cytochrome/quinol oxidase subunit 2
VDPWVTASARRTSERVLWAASLLALGAAGVGASGDVPPPPPRAIEMIASRFKFEPETLQVTQGDRVRLTLRSADTEHGFTIKKMNVRVAVPKTGEPVTVEFVADRPGTYEFKCSEYCGSGHGRMKGQLVVTPRAP